MNSPSLADDEATLAKYAAALADAIEAAVPSWFDRCVGRAVPFDTWVASPAGAGYLIDRDQAVTDIVDQIRELLGRDIADQAVGPLELLRRATAFPTAVMRDEGAPPARRDDFAERSFPDDTYDLSPASFADVDQSLHEPGLVWGAAKAHVHLRRRREQAAEQADGDLEQVVVLCTDLMDRSKISSAYPKATFVRNLDALMQAVTPESIALVDLSKVDDPSVLANLAGRVVAFGSHVDEDTLQAATDAGAQALPRSVFFKRLTSGGDLP